MLNTNQKPTLLFIFGGSGDLTNRKLIPALYNLFLDGWLPKNMLITGIGRTSFDSDDAYREKLLEGVKEFSRRTDKLKETWATFASQVNYYELDLLDDATYAKLIEVIRTKTAEWNEEPVVIFYLAVAPQLAPEIAKKLSEQHLCDLPSSTRMVFEKPFGRDLKSALALNALLAGMFTEEQIFRIDHYLGKETVQNILAFRFANLLFEPVWNSYYIDHVQITVAETVGVGDRGTYYEQAGALRDMVQNHILQLLCMIAMEPPISFDA
ncbi:MAG TPA: hypothetical protein VLJ68_07560, partial [Chitinophagaceae bacterium]|nr:hypothetical protein [Chitinophagaceae bacterium]